MDEALMDQIGRVAAELEIRNLLARYCFAMDDRDIPEIGEIFTRNARVWSGDGVKDSRGRDALVEMYEGRFAVLGATNHIVHHTVIKVESDVRATGKVSAHAEVFRNGKQQIAGLRYEDVYEKEEGRWRIADRKMLYLYYTPVEKYSTILATRERNLTYDRPIAADVPEGTLAFQTYQARQAEKASA